MCIDPFRRLLACGVWLLVLISAPLQAQVLELTQAHLSVAEGSHVGVGLPWSWDRTYGGHAGQAHLVVPWQLAEPPSQALALFIPKLGNAFELRVNGWLLLRKGELERPDASDHGKLPQWVTVPAELLRTDNLIDIRLRADSGRRAGVSTVWAGPLDEIERLYEVRQWERFSLTVFILTLSLGVGLLAFALAWTQRGLNHPQDRRSRRVFIVAGLAESAWSLRLLDHVWVNPPLPWSVWSVISSLAYLVWIGSALIFCHQVCGVRLAWQRQAVMVFFVGGLASAALSRALYLPVLWTVWMACTAAALIAYGLWFGGVLLRWPLRLMRGLVAVAALANIGAGAWNWWVFRWSHDVTGAGSVQRYTSVLFTGVLLLILLQRFRAASIRARNNISLLDQKVAQREQALVQAFARQEQLARDQARQQERGRIWRDLHDGMGAHLNSALRQLESDQVERAAIAATLRDISFQLKLSVDVMALPPGDLGVMLGNLRYRLGSRFESAGLTFDWDVQELPWLSVLETHHAQREVQFILYEALSNVLQHAGARRVLVQARPVSGGVLLRIEDDGGPRAQAITPGQGLRSMHERARSLGLTLRLSFSERGVEVALLIPTD